MHSGNRAHPPVAQWQLLLLNVVAPGRIETCPLGVALPSQGMASRGIRQASSYAFLLRCF